MIGLALLLAFPALAASPVKAEAARAESPQMTAQKSDFKAAFQLALKEGTTAQVSSIAGTLGFDRSLRCKLLRYRQDDSPDDAEHVFALFYSTASGGWRLVGAQVSREKGHMGIDGKTVMSATAWRLDMNGLIVRAIDIPEGPIGKLTAQVLGVGRQSVAALRDELKFQARTAPQLKLEPAR